MDISLLFSSLSKYRILSILSKRSRAVHLRALVELSGVQIRSVQLAVESLLKAKVITKHRQGNRCLFALNPNSKFTCHLRMHFQAEEERRIASRAAQYRNASEVIEQIHQLRTLSWSK